MKSDIKWITNKFEVLTPVFVLLAHLDHRPKFYNSKQHERVRRKCQVSKFQNISSQIEQVLKIWITVCRHRLKPDESYHSTKVHIGRPTTYTLSISNTVLPSLIDFISAEANFKTKSKTPLNFIFIKVTLNQIRMG